MCRYTDVETFSTRDWRQTKAAATAHTAQLLQVENGGAECVSSAFWRQL